MSVANDIDAMPPRLGARARLAAIGDMASDVAVFAAVVGIGALIVGLCAVGELLGWVKEERRK